MDELSLLHSHTVRIQTQPVWAHVDALHFSSALLLSPKGLLTSLA